MNKTEKTIYELLKNGVLFRNETGIYSIFPQKLLVQASGKSERTVQYALKGLEEQHYITRIMYQQVNMVRIYFLREDDLTGCEIIDHFENDRPPLENCTPPLENCTPPLENCPSPLENCPSPLENCPSPLENCPSPLENCTPPLESCPSPLENDDFYTFRVGEIPPEGGRIIVQKSFHPHTERSELMAQKPFYDMPDSPASHFLFDILSAEDGVGDIPPRKRQVNHNTTYEVKENGSRRLLSMENREGTASVTVELTDIDKLNKAGKKFLILALIKANEQALHCGQLTRDYISFPLQELVDCGLYTRLSGARKGFEAGADALTSIKVKGTIRKSKKSTATITALEVPFTGAKIENNQCTIYLNHRIDWNFLAQYFTKLPKYYFRLPSRASDLLYYIFYLARQHTKEIAGKGYFTIGFQAIHSLLKLPDPQTARNPQRDIKDVIENAVTEIETAHETRYGHTELAFELIYDESSSVTEYLTNGYLKVRLNGSFAEPFHLHSESQEKKIQQAEKKAARIAEKAIAIRKTRTTEQ